MDELTLRSLLSQEETYDIEYKTAASSFSKNKLNDYLAAIANENGGQLFLGVNNDREIVGSKAFLTNWNRLAHQLSTELSIRVKVYKIDTSEGRVLCFEIPRHPTATPIQVRGGTGEYRYPIRDGESIVEMSTDTLQQIFAEREDDWSAECVEGVTLSDLEDEALRAFRARWAHFSRKPERLKVNYEKMLNDLQLSIDGKLTNAALILFADEATLARHIPDAEIIFEWRNNEKDIAFGERRSWRRAFMAIETEVWGAIDARNSTFHYQEGFIQNDIPAFNERAIREAIVNAFAHRDYRIVGRSIVIKASPTSFHIENPGRLMPGVTLDNIFEKSEWRNRRLAECLEKVHIMERSSQGMDIIFYETIAEGKGLPTLQSTHDPSISLTIPATLKDQYFVDFISSVAQKYQVTFSTREIIELEKIRQGEKIKQPLFKDKFIELGIIERLGRGQGTYYILSHNYYKHTNSTGRHTRLSGLSRSAKRLLILEHLDRNKIVRNADLQEALPEMDMKTISALLKGLAKEGLIEHEGSKRTGYWRLVTNIKNS